jgi:mannobiose 2-epimerase
MSFMITQAFRSAAPVFIITVLLVSCISKPGIRQTDYNKDSLTIVLDNYLKKGIIDAWYPLIIDNEDGGYFSNLSFDMKLSPDQPKMLVSQSRQIWTSSQAAIFYNDSSYTKYARHGVRFLIEHMWDNEFGGFLNLRTREGSAPEGASADEKRAYGNAFAIYGLSSYYQLTKDPVALDYAKKTFMWLDDHSRDKINGGYIDAMDRTGTWLSRLNTGPPQSGMSTSAYKDFNSSIHLLEAFSELYKVWPDPMVRERLTEMLKLVRDTFTTHKGYLTLYFTEDWKPVSNRDSSETVIRRKSGLDHVSFGHDIETGFLILEASHALGIENDTTTLRVAKKLVDHTIANGFDRRSGALFDAGYYFPGRDTITILNKNAEWWVEAEGLNALLLMAGIFPEEEKYFDAFLKLWIYVEANVIDKEHGEWYQRGLLYSPKVKNAPKASIWKANYHNGRTLMNGIRMLKGEYKLTEHFAGIRKRSE